MNTSCDILNSWKDIAAYLGRGIRTVQRWERQLGLPIHRPRGRDRSAVIAFKEELNQWLQQTPRSKNGEHRFNPKDHHELAEKAERLCKVLQEIAIRNPAVKEQINAALELATAVQRQLFVDSARPCPTALVASVNRVQRTAKMGS